MNTYWLTLHSNAFLWVKKDKGLIYNTENFFSFLFSLTEEIRDLCTMLLDPSSLYTVEIEERVLNIPEMRGWINRILEIEAGTLIEKADFVERPVELLPLCKVQDDVNHYAWLQRQNAHGVILENLHELYFFINGSSHGEDEYLRQTVFPLKNSAVLDFKLIKDFTYRLPILAIHLVGDLLNYPDYLGAVTYLAKEGFHPTIDCIVTDICDNDRIKELCAVENLTLNLIYPPMRQELQAELWRPKPLENLRYTFLVADEASYQNIYPLLEENRAKSRIIPIYTGDNEVFFKEHVFLTPEDMEGLKLTKREIFSHQLLNSNFFGKLFVLPDGTVYSNLNAPSVGTIHEHLHDLVYKEMKEGDSWLSVRRASPCAECVYQWLCPPPSNYERVMKKANLCLCSG